MIKIDNEAIKQLSVPERVRLAWSAPRDLVQVE
jgi:hypothetical protein